jgi:serine/threonine-protein kinase RsbW
MVSGGMVSGGKLSAAGFRDPGRCWGVEARHRPRSGAAFGVLPVETRIETERPGYPSPVAEEPDRTVTLVVPAAADYLRLARLASADAGSRAGFDYEEIDDLRIAVTELCHLLIGEGTRGELTIEFTAADGTVAVAGHAGHPGAPNDNEFSETILSQVVDTHTVRDHDDGRRFELVKRHQG